MKRDETGAARICVTNAKGGTGKTTITINVAGALNDRGRDVLLVDLDPQGNATEGLGLVEAYDASPPTLFDALTDADRRTLVNDLVVEHAEMDVLPSNVALLGAQKELTIAELMTRLESEEGTDEAIRALSSLALNASADGDTAGLRTLDRTLAALDRNYDYVLIDSPPFYGNLTDTGIVAAGNVLVPALTEATSERAIELLTEQIGALEEYAGMTVDTVGVVANRVENTNEDEMMLDWLNAAFPDARVWEVRKRVALQRAFSAGRTVFGYDRSVDMADVFLDIAATLDDRFGYTELPA